MRDIAAYIERDQFFLIAGPCVVESEETCFTVAKELKGICTEFDIPLIFKSSYRKANRTKLSSFTGIGDREALQILAEVGKRYDVPTLTDIHTEDEAVEAAQYVDVLQIPAFLCRQTALLVAAAQTGKAVNIKKGQFMNAQAMKHAVVKVTESGNANCWLTERGNTFGYEDLVVDYRNIPWMQAHGVPVILDCTHALQKPNQASGVTGGMPELIPTIAKAGIAAGVDGLFIETHPNPSVALSDGANMLKLDNMYSLLKGLVRIRQAIK